MLICCILSLFVLNVCAMEEHNMNYSAADVVFTVWEIQHLLQSSWITFASLRKWKWNTGFDGKRRLRKVKTVFFVTVVLLESELQTVRAATAKHEILQLRGRMASAVVRAYGAVKCRLIWRFRGQALLLRVLHVVACDDVRDCVFLKDDLNSVKNGFNSYELNFSVPTNSQNKLTELN